MSQNTGKGTRIFLLTTGIVFIVLSVVVLAISLWEGFGGMSKKFQTVALPGFHELDIQDPGLFGGIYQHRSPGPMPVKALSQLEIRILFKDTYEEIPVLMNTTGQTFNQFGVLGMPVFNFVAQQAGPYTMSALYPEGVDGPRVSVMIFPQSAQNIKQTLIVGGIFFLLFLILGILILVNVNKWAPKASSRV